MIMQPYLDSSHRVEVTTSGTIPMSWDCDRSFCAVDTMPMTQTMNCNHALVSNQGEASGFAFGDPMCMTSYSSGEQRSVQSNPIDGFYFAAPIPQSISHASQQSIAQSAQLEMQCGIGVYASEHCNPWSQPPQQELGMTNWILHDASQEQAMQQMVEQGPHGALAQMGGSREHLSGGDQRGWFHCMPQQTTPQGVFDVSAPQAMQQCMQIMDNGHCLAAQARATNFVEQQSLQQQSRIIDNSHVLAEEIGAANVVVHQAEQQPSRPRARLQNKRLETIVNQNVKTDPAPVMPLMSCTNSTPCIVANKETLEPHAVPFEKLEGARETVLAQKDRSSIIKFLNLEGVAANSWHKLKSWQPPCQSPTLLQEQHCKEEEDEKPAPKCLSTPSVKLVTHSRAEVVQIACAATPMHNSKGLRLKNDVLRSSNAKIPSISRDSAPTVTLEDTQLTPMETQARDNCEAVSIINDACRLEGICQVPFAGNGKHLLFCTLPPYSRHDMMAWRHEVEQHEQRYGLCAAQWPEGSDSQEPAPQLKEPEPIDRKLFGSKLFRKTNSQRKEQLQSLKPSETAYKIQKPQAREKILERTIRDLLNKTCPEKFDRILQLFRHVKITCLNDMKLLVSLIFEKALDETHYCETHAKLVFCLEKAYPLFPPREGSKNGTPQSLMTVLKDAVQAYFEKLMSGNDSSVINGKTPEEIVEHNKKQKMKHVASMKFMGQLYLWEVLPVKIIAMVAQELLLGAPEEDMVECAVELLQAVGSTFADTKTGQKVIADSSTQLSKLMAATCKSGQHVYSNRIQFKVKDFHDLRRNHWKLKVFREQATTKENVKKDAVAAAKASEVTFSTKVFGMKPAGIDALKTAKIAQQHPDMAPVSIVKADFKDPAQFEAGIVEDGTEQVVHLKGMVESDQDSQHYDLAHLKRVLAYYAEDKDFHSFVRDWSNKSASGIQQSLAWLLEIGFESVDGEDACAEVVARLVIQQVVPWMLLKDTLVPFLSDLEDIRLDAPHADKFFCSLLARLLLARDVAAFDSVIFEALPIAADQDSQLARDLIIGALKQVDALGGVGAVCRVWKYEDLLATALAAWGGEDPPELAALLQDRDAQSE